MPTGGARAVPGPLPSVLPPSRPTPSHLFLLVSLLVLTSAPAGMATRRGRATDAHGFPARLSSAFGCACSAHHRGCGLRADRHHAETAFRLRHRRRLSARHLRAVCRLLAEARQRIGSDEGRGDRPHGRRPAAADGRHHVSRKPQETRSLQGYLPPAGARRGPHSTTRPARSRKRAKASSGSTVVCTPRKSSARIS